MSLKGGVQDDLPVDQEVGGLSLGVDATTLEANVALRSIVRRDTREVVTDEG